MTLQDDVTLPGESPKVERVRSKNAAFPKMTAVAQKLSAAEGSVANGQWEFGDAVIDECGAPGANGRKNGSAAKLKQAAEALAKAGFPYDEKTLRDFRKVAAAFPPADRSAAVSWTIHRVAGSPEVLRAAMQRADRDGASLTKTYVARFVKEHRSGSKPDGIKAVEKLLRKVKSLSDGLSPGERALLAPEVRALAATLEAEHHEEAE